MHEASDLPAAFPLRNEEESIDVARRETVGFFEDSRKVVLPARGWLNFEKIR